MGEGVIMYNEIICRENLIRNIEAIRYKDGLSQCKMAEEIDMSPHSYRRLANNEMNLHASFVLLNLCVKWNVDLLELMGIEDYRFDVARKVRYLDSDQLEALDKLLDCLLREKEEV